MHRQFTNNLAACFRDLGIAAAYALAAGIAATLVATIDDRTLSVGWLLFDVGALPAGVVMLIGCEAACCTLRDARPRASLHATARR